MSLSLQTWNGLLTRWAEEIEVPGETGKVFISRSLITNSLANTLHPLLSNISYLYF
jgi:hypothetical protein